MITSVRNSNQKSWQPWQLLKQKIDKIEIEQAKTARLIVNIIPAQCPFARDLKIGGKVLFSIPPLCKLNPVYEELVALRFRALCFLVDRCGEDISLYC